VLVSEQEIIELKNFVLQLTHIESVVAVEGKRDHTLRKLGFLKSFGISQV